MKTLTKALTLTAVVLLLAATAAGAKGRGGGNGSASASGSTFQKGTGGPQGQQTGGRGAGTASQDRRKAGPQQQRLHVPDQQRGQYQDCTAASDRMRQQGREMAKAAGGSGFNAAEARRQHDQVRQHAEAAFRQHDRLMGSFGDGARGALGDRTRTLDRDRDRIHAHLQAMDRELGRGNPDRNNLRAEARQLNRAMKSWQRHYRQLGQDLGATAG